jgi:hypothetical protein
MSMKISFIKGICGCGMKGDYGTRRNSETNERP